MRLPIEWLILDDAERVRFDSKVSDTTTATGCVLWTGAKNSQGYGHLSVSRDGATRHLYAHRIAAVARYGTFTADLMVDHVCHTRDCVNSMHLRLVTNKQNGENRSGANPRSATGVRGVFWVPNRRKWMGEVRHNNQPYRTKCFSTIEEADEAVRALRIEIFTHSQEIAS